jgi:hypothetical protein
MNTTQQNLRSLVDKWLAPTAATPVHVARFGRLGSNHRRYVCVEASHPSGMLAIFFFAWSVESMGGWRLGEIAKCMI